MLKLIVSAFLIHLGAFITLSLRTEEGHLADTQFYHLVSGVSKGLA